MLDDRCDHPNHYGCSCSACPTCEDLRAQLAELKDNARMTRNHAESIADQVAILTIKLAEAKQRIRDASELLECTRQLEGSSCLDFFDNCGEPACECGQRDRWCECCRAVEILRRSK